jgi:hypothetical protein
MLPAMDSPVLYGSALAFDCTTRACRTPVTIKCFPFFYIPKAPNEAFPAGQTYSLSWSVELPEMSQNNEKLTLSTPSDYVSIC